MVHSVKSWLAILPVNKLIVYTTVYEVWHSSMNTEMPIHNNRNAKSAKQSNTNKHQIKLIPYTHKIFSAFQCLQNQNKVFLGKIVTSICSNSNHKPYITSS